MAVRRTKRLIRRTLLFAAAALIFAGCGAAASGAPPESGSATGSPTAVTPNATVKRVVDGDTIVASVDGHDQRVRFIGVDTPETVDPRRPVGCYGTEASDFTKALLPKGTPVQLVTDAETTDRYDRLLAYVYRSTDGLFVNAELARGGYAQQLTIPPNIAHESEFGALVAEARSNQRGLWGSCSESDVTSAGS